MLLWGLLCTFATMIRLIVCIFVAFIIAPHALAQKKELSQARSYIKSGKNLDKAEKLLLGLLQTDSVNRENPKIYALLYQTIRKQYDAGNEKLYLRQQYDTAALFNLTKRMFQLCEQLDSIDARPDKKGRVRPEYRKRHAEELNAIRLNLYLGGRYFLGKNNAGEAYPYFHTYLDCAQQPLFSDYDYGDDDDTLFVQAAYWATYTGWRENNPEHVLRYAGIALSDTTRAPFTLQYMAEAYHALRQDSLYAETLSYGFQHYMQHIYFYTRLMDRYNAREQYEQGLELTEQALQQQPDNQLFLFGKSSLLLNMGRNDESLLTSQHLIQLNDSLAEAYFNAGTALLNQVLPLERNIRRNRKKIKELYQQARPYMEQYRQLAPDQKGKWAPALYKIYLNLNMGRQFEEIDRLMKE